ncbi:ATP-grasp domain-domain-containing protein, partial [Catenaria anguillulae PL171]
MAIVNILILDDVGTPSVCRAQPTYSTFASPTEANLFIITSIGGLCPADKARATASCELAQPTTDGSLELIALAWHREYTIHHVYTPQEDLLIRAAGIRKLLGIRSGMSVETAVAFRDKALMKQIAVNNGIPTTAFQRLQSPSDLLSLVSHVGLPVIVKPTLGSASAGIRVLRTQADVGQYLRSEFFRGRVSDESGQFDVPADIVAEAFLPPDVPMYHVNGLIENGKVVGLWAFGYISTNLAFTQGKPYGNKAILPRDDPVLYKELVSTTERVLDAFQKELGGVPLNTAFHCELFRVDTNSNPVLVLCEVASRRPGGSITSLMDAMQSNNSLPFAHVEFRSFIGLPHPKIQLAPNVCAADLLIPHKPMSIMLSMPNPAAFPFSDTIKYIPSRCYPSGRAYRGYCVGLLNTVARFRVVGTMSLSAMETQLQLAHEWFQRN